MTAPQETEQRSPEWHKARIGRVTGSVAGAILSCDPNKKREDVLRRMVRDHLGAENESDDNIAVSYGRNNEDGALFEFQLETSLDVKPCGFLPYEDWLGASPDGLPSDNSVLEIKSPFSRRKLYGDKSGQEKEFKTLAEQPQYYAQMQIEMLCAGVDKAHFYQWSANKTTHEIVNLDQPWLDENLPRLRQFHAEFLDTIADPELAAEHLAPKRVTIDTPEAAKMIREYDELSEQIELATERKKDLLKDIAALGKGKNALVAGRKVTKVSREGAIKYAAIVKEKLPDLDTSPWRGKSSEFWKVT